MTTLRRYYAALVDRLADWLYARLPDRSLRTVRYPYGGIVVELELGEMDAFEREAAAHIDGLLPGAVRARALCELIGYHCGESPATVAAAPPLLLFAAAADWFDREGIGAAGPAPVDR